MIVTQLVAQQLGALIFKRQFRFYASTFQPRRRAAVVHHGGEAQILNWDAAAHGSTRRSDRETDREYLPGR